MKGMKIRKMLKVNYNKNNIEREKMIKHQRIYGSILGTLLGATVFLSSCNTGTPTGGPSPGASPSGGTVTSPSPVVPTITPSGSSSVSPAPVVSPSASASMAPVVPAVLDCNTIITTADIKSVFGEDVQENPINDSTTKCTKSFSNAQGFNAVLKVYEENPTSLIASAKDYATNSCKGVASAGIGEYDSCYNYGSTVTFGKGKNVVTLSCQGSGASQEKTIALAKIIEKRF